MMRRAIFQTTRPRLRCTFPSPLSLHLIRKQVELGNAFLQGSTSNRVAFSSSFAKNIGCDRISERVERFVEDELELRRASAAESIPHWIRHDPSWREETVQALADLNASSRGASLKRSDLFLLEYEQFYQDSLPTFLAKFLKKDEISPKLLRALDLLVEVGFDNPDFSANYRRFISRMEDDGSDDVLGNTATAILKLRKELKSVRQKKGKATRKLEKLVKDSNRPTKQSTLKPIIQEPQVWWARSGDPVSALIVPPESESSSTTTDGDSNTEEFSSLDNPGIQRRINKLKQTIENCDDLLATNQAAVAELESQQADFFDIFVERDELKHVSKAVEAARKEVAHVFATHIQERHSSILEKYQKVHVMTDLTSPHDWFPDSRKKRRRIVFHGGPTNSGKTHMALERLKEADKGMYLGPLRLLTAEVHDKLTNLGTVCNLYTGQEKQEFLHATHSAATIEMADLRHEYDVVVIDEIQMIADKERGHAWTRALLGVQCNELHLCGGLEARKLVEKVSAACNDDFELVQYERFAPLTVADTSLARRTGEPGSYRAVTIGDCVVAFSRDDIFAIKREIETYTNFKCVVIYGALPPSTRREQANLFNDPNSGYDVLVASDAIGMGLNLNIRRIILNSIFKNDGGGVVRLSHSAVKQICGRAGRRNSQYPAGHVSCRDPNDLQYIQKCMKTEVADIGKAGLLPSSQMIEQFSQALVSSGLSSDSEDLHDVLQQFSEMATVTSDYFLCRQTLMMTIAAELAGTDLSTREKYTLCVSPVSVKSTSAMNMLKTFAHGLRSDVLDGPPEYLVPRPPNSFGELAQLCTIYNELELYLWLRLRFPAEGDEDIITGAQSKRDLAIRYIGEALLKTDSLELVHCYLSRARRLRKAWENKRMSKR